MNLSDSTIHDKIGRIIMRHALKIARTPAPKKESRSIMLTAEESTHDEEYAVNARELKIGHVYGIMNVEANFESNLNMGNNSRRGSAWSL